MSNFVKVCYRKVNGANAFGWLNCSGGCCGGDVFILSLVFKVPPLLVLRYLMSALVLFKSRLFV